jgi:hypothetical protein
MSSDRRSCHAVVGDADLGDLGARVEPDTLAMIRDGFERERRAVIERRESARQIVEGVRRAREQDDRAGYFDIARGLIPGGTGDDTRAIHARRLRLAATLRDRVYMFRHRR